MTDYGVSGAEFELYTCWAEEEGLPRNKSMIESLIWSLCHWRMVLS